MSNHPKITIYSEVSIDGKTAFKTGGNSIEMMSAESADIQKFRHSMRSTNDAILVGANTVLIDNPKLTVRHVSGVNPLRVIIAPRTALPLSSTVISDGNPTIIVTTEKLYNSYYKINELPSSVLFELIASPILDLGLLLTNLFDRYGISSMIVEGGAQTIASFVHADLVDEIVLQTLPYVFGGSGPTFCAGEEPKNLGSTKKFHLNTVRAIGQHAVQIYSKLSPILIENHK